MFHQGKVCLAAMLIQGLAVLLISVPANLPDKVLKDGPNTRVSATNPVNLGEVSGFCLLPVLDLTLWPPGECVKDLSPQHLFSLL